MMNHYKRANDALHPTPRAVERAVGGRIPNKKRRPLKALIPAGAAAVAAALLISGIPGAWNSGPLTASACAIAQPVYPDLPQYPAAPSLYTEAAWERYQEECDISWSAWRDYREQVPGLHETPELEQNLASFAGASTVLALSGEGNRVYSPVSLWFALAMLAETTGGETRQQVLDALGAEDLEQLRDWADILWHDLYLDDGTATILLGNSIWLNESVTFHRDVLETLAQRYYAGSYQVPMGTGEADQALTDWVAEQTNGLIGSDGKVLETTADTLNVLASTLYFQAGWSDEFNDRLTEEDIFTAADGTETRVDFMHKIQDANFLRQDGYQAAYLGTKGGIMTFVLPDEGVTPADLLADPDFLQELTQSEKQIYGEVQWSVPKFDVSSSLDLIPTLTGLGINDVLDPETADFTPLTDIEPVWLDQARQIARVKVDEKGVEAAAVTLLSDEAASVPPEDARICVMDLDRPFLFVIRNGETILFVGVVEHV